VIWQFWVALAPVKDLLTDSGMRAAAPKKRPVGDGLARIIQRCSLHFRRCRTLTGMSFQTVREDRADLEREKRFLIAHAAAHDRIYRYLRRRAENAATAEDLCAEVFRIAWEKSTDSESLSVMVLFGVARNVLRNHDRSSVRAAKLIGELRPPEQHGDAEACSQEYPLREALHRLSPEDREVLLLTYWDGFSSREISDLLNTSATAIRMRLHRARKALAHLIQTEGAEQ
jgi:RNA polymerase sigma-70 factor (ECF subfamily)